MSLTSEARKQIVARWRPRLLEAFRVGKPLVITPDECAELMDVTFALDDHPALPTVQIQIEGKTDLVGIAVDTSPIVTMTVEWNLRF